MLTLDVLFIVYRRYFYEKLKEFNNLSACIKEFYS